MLNIIYVILIFQKNAFVFIIRRLVELFGLNKIVLNLFKNCMRILKTLIFFLSVVHSLFAFGQDNRTIDSLNVLLSKVKDDTNKVIILNNLCNQYENSDPKKALVYANKGDSLATYLNFQRGKALCLDNIGTLYCNQGEYENALVNYFKALKINEAIGNKKGISDNLSN